MRPRPIATRTASRHRAHRRPRTSATHPQRCRTNTRTTSMNAAICDPVNVHVLTIRTCFFPQEPDSNSAGQRQRNDDAPVWLHHRFVDKVACRFACIVSEVRTLLKNETYGLGLIASTLKSIAEIILRLAQFHRRLMHIFLLFYNLYNIMNCNLSFRYSAQFRTRIGLLANGRHQSVARGSASHTTQPERQRNGRSASNTAHGGRAAQQSNVPATSVAGRTCVPVSKNNIQNLIKLLTKLPHTVNVCICAPTDARRRPFDWAPHRWV